MHATSPHVYTHNCHVMDRYEQELSSFSYAHNTYNRKTPYTKLVSVTNMIPHDTMTMNACYIHHTDIHCVHNNFCLNIEHVRMLNKKNLLFEARIYWPHSVSFWESVCISPLQLLRTIYLFDNQFRIYKYFLKSTIFVFLSCKKHRSLSRKSFTFIPTYHTRTQPHTPKNAIRSRVNQVFVMIFRSLYG